MGVSLLCRKEIRFIKKNIPTESGCFLLKAIPGLIILKHGNILVSERRPIGGTKPEAWFKKKEPNGGPKPKKRPSITFELPQVPGRGRTCRRARSCALGRVLSRDGSSLSGGVRTPGEG